MVHLVYSLTNLLFFDIPLLYYCINLISSIILCLFWRYIYFYLLWILWNFCNSTSNFITNRITSSFYCFLNYSLWSSFKYISCKSFSINKKFWQYLPHTFLLIFLLILLAKDKNPISGLSWICCHFVYFILN